MRKKIKCPETLGLIDLIIDNSNKQEPNLQWFPGDDLFTPVERRKGLPIGNLTSQFWGNVYLNGLDHFVKEILQAPGYIRYVDDFVLFEDDKEKLHYWEGQIKEYLNSLRLELHPKKSQIFQTKNGVPFLGFCVLPTHCTVLKPKLRRYKRFLGKLLELKAQNRLTPQSLENRLNAWLGHIRFGQSRRFENRIFSYLYSHGVELHRSPSGSWRVLEQQR